MSILNDIANILLATAFLVIVWSIAIGAVWFVLGIIRNGRL